MPLASDNLPLPPEIYHEGAVNVFVNTSQAQILRYVVSFFLFPFLSFLFLSHFHSSRTPVSLGTEVLRLWTIQVFNLIVTSDEQGWGKPGGFPGWG